MQEVKLWDPAGRNMFSLPGLDLPTGILRLPTGAFDSQGCAVYGGDVLQQGPCRVGIVVYCRTHFAWGVIELSFLHGEAVQRPGLRPLEKFLKKPVQLAGNIYQTHPELARCVEELENDM